MKITKKLLTLALAALMLLSLAVPALADDSDFVVVGGSLWSYDGPGGDVVIPNEVTNIIGFSSSKPVTSVTIPSSVTSIGDSAFAGCTMKTVYIPASVKDFSTGNNFGGCTNLTDVYYAGTEEQWNKMTNNLWLPMFGVYGVDGAGNGPTIHYNSAGPGTPATPEPTPTTPEPTPTTPSFGDVAANAYYAEPVKWAVEKDITNGTTSTTFSPETTCNTAQILTFLWRASGKPEAPESTLTDVKSTDYYYGAAQWAKSKGMISGDALSPETPCTRASTVMFIWQAAGSPSVETKTAFTDVSADADYAMAVAWAVENGVTTGTSSTAFSPDQTCTRGQIATFLYRAFAE